MTQTTEPYGWGKLIFHPTNEGESLSRACGDRVRIRINLQAHLINDINIEGECCSICTASSSILAQYVKGENLNDILHIKKQLYNFFIDKEEFPNIEKLNLLKSISRFPNRTNCVMLPWEALEKAINNEKR